MDYLSQVQVLDPRQKQRIEGVHRGFLYQHLYAVGCLLLMSKVDGVSVIVERDEDIELLNLKKRVYIQVKTRSQAIMPSDIKDTLNSFERLREEHLSGKREELANYIIIVNQPMGPKLASLVKDGTVPSYVSIQWPGMSIPEPLEGLPPAWKSIGEAVDWCINIANQLPYTLLSSESLIWKLAGLVQLAASGSPPYSDHAFKADRCPELFEQLLIQIQSFPSSPIPYRPQINEPSLQSDQRIRIIAGFSGSGKTAWAAQAALHSGYNCIYFDTGDTPGPSIATALVRELGAKLMTSGSTPPQQIFLPGSIGIEPLRLLDTYLGQQGLNFVVVMDNAHRIPSGSLLCIIEATQHIHFVLLCQPSDSIQEVEARLFITRESLLGWSLDTLAMEVEKMGAQGTVSGLQRLLTLTAGMPLYVQSSALIAVCEFGGNIDHLCEALDSQTHTNDTLQEMILLKVFNSFPLGIQNVVAVLSLSDVGLSISEVQDILSRVLQLTKSGAASAIRKLRPSGIVQTFGNQQLKIHDAIRVLGKQHYDTFDGVLAKLALETLKDILIKALTKRRDTIRFSLLIRTFIDLGDIDTLIDLSGEEIFHEMGLGEDIFSTLKTASESETTDPKNRFWALHGLVFGAMKTGADEDKIEGWLSNMEQLLNDYELGYDETMDFLMKRMLYQASQMNGDAVFASIEQMAKRMPDSQMHQRIFRYNAAYALLKLGRFEDAEEIINDVIKDYFDALGITPEQITLKNPSEIYPLLKSSESTHEDLKHLADSLELYAITINEQNRDSGAAQVFFCKSG